MLNVHRGQGRSILLAVVLVVAAIAFKWVYLKTAESAYNIEELPLSALTLAGGSETLANVAATRLYGTSNITTTLSLKAFGFNALGLKFPNIIFFALSVVFLSLFCRRLVSMRDGSAWLLPAVLLIMGPPVIQMWGMKNRGGFIESIFALVLCLWICARPGREGVISPLAKLMLATVIGLAIWSQPISLVWGAVIIAYVIWQEATMSLRTVPRSTLVILLGLLLGLLPLLQLNFLFNFNTFEVLGKGETINGVDLGMAGRVRELLLEGVPRLLGLKEQWNKEWLLWQPAAWLLYCIFVAPSIWATTGIVSDFLRTRQLRPETLVVGVAGAVVIANIVSSWGNFQAEPRRLLLLYVPFAILTAIGLIRTKGLLVPYVVLWCCFNMWANYEYVAKNREGFAHPMYEPLDDVAAFLEAKGIGAVYTDVWTGGRITFESDGRIPWYQSEYQPSAYGYVGDDELKTREAMAFNLHDAIGGGARESFLSDLAAADIKCVEDVVQNISIVHHCSRNLHLAALPVQAMKSRLKPGDAAIDLEANAPEIRTIAGVKKRGVLAATGAPGFVMYGPYKPLPEGAYTIELDGNSTTPFTLDLSADNGRLSLARIDLPGAQNRDERQLARLDFQLDEPVRDLEVRVQVPAGSDVEIDGYRVIVH